VTCNAHLGTAVGLDPDPAGDVSFAEVLCGKPATWTQGPAGFSLCDDHMNEWASGGDDCSTFALTTPLLEPSGGAHG